MATQAVTECVSLFHNNSASSKDDCTIIAFSTMILYCICALQKVQQYRHRGYIVKLIDYNASCMSQTESCQCDAAED
jgi:hypothetical protein